MNESMLPERLQAVLHEELPLARFMEVRVEAWNDEGLRLHAAEAPNQNVHGTAFGGSVAALALLAGWGLVWLSLQEAGIEPDVVVHKTESHYDRPIRGDLWAQADRPERTDWDRFFRTLERRGLARIPVTLHIGGAGTAAGASRSAAGASMTAWYVARLER